MPFDAISEKISNDQSVYQKRREDAATLWRSVPSADFDLSAWECGTTACALGWLACRQHDGWSKTNEKGWRKAPHIISDGVPIYGFRAAGIYFDLSYHNALKCFGQMFHGPSFYGHPATDDMIQAMHADNVESDLHRELRKFLSTITPEMVADKLLTLPYACEMVHNTISA